MSNAEVQAWIAKLEAENKSTGRRNVTLAAALVAGLILLTVIFWGVYQSMVRSYAVLEDVVISRNPANQGRLEISFRVVSPGIVSYRRTSGSISTEVVDSFANSREVRWGWSWVYEPGKDIDVLLSYRDGLWRRSVLKSFPTAKSADIVILMDTTGSMSRSIDSLMQECGLFSRKLQEQALNHRFALIGFGDTSEDRWLDKHDFTSNVEQFKNLVEQIERFDGGDHAESALDAIEAALVLPFDEDAVRRFYLVTDAPFHEPSKAGADSDDLRARLEKKQVLLNVFSQDQYEGDYGRLLGSSGKFQQIEDFGKALAEGRILED